MQTDADFTKMWTDYAVYRSENVSKSCWALPFWMHRRSCYFVVVQIFIDC